MESNSSDFETADAFANQYDASAEQYCWTAPEVLFELISDRIEPGDRVLDLGIGTGLSSVPFQKAGLQIYGVDGSGEMLRHCALRGVAKELKQHDIRSAHLPYSDSYFDHVIASGVFHLIGRINGIIGEAARVIRNSGTFVFTTEELQPEGHDVEGSIVDGVLEIKNEKTGVLSYQHSDNLIEDTLSQNSFTTIYKLDFVAFQKTDWADERTFRAYVSVKNQKT